MAFCQNKFVENPGIARPDPYSKTRTGGIRPCSGLDPVMPRKWACILLPRDPFDKAGDCR